MIHSHGTQDTYQQIHALFLTVEKVLLLTLSLVKRKQKR